MTASTLDLGHFFTGKLAREEAASAFVAMMLEGSPEFRRHFFDGLHGLHGLDDSLLAELERASFDVRVEVDNVDIRLDSRDGTPCTILIENKVRAGSLRCGQLAEYYASALAKSSKRRFLILYLTPRTVGASEVAAMRRGSVSGIRQEDVVGQICWHHVLAFRDQLWTTDPLHTLLRSGFEAIAEAIESADQVRYPAVGDRALFIDAAFRAKKLLTTAWETISSHSERAEIVFTTFRSRDYAQVEVQRSPVTVYVQARFEVGPEPAFLPQDIWDGDQLSVFLHVRVAQSVAAARDPERRARWQPHLDRGWIDVPGGDELELRDRG